MHAAPQPSVRSWWMPAAVVAAGIVAYLGSFRGVFLLDDVRSIVEDPSIRRLASAWGSRSGADRPLVSLSLALNYAIGGLTVWSYHLFNLAVHLLAALALFDVVERTLATPRLAGTSRDSARAFAFVVALLWVLHPLETASVTYVIQRAESMMGLFYLLTLDCVIRGAATRRPLPWYGAAVLACALGMATKAVMVTAPVVVLLYDRVFLSGSWAETLRRRGALHAGLFATLAILFATGIAGTVLSPTPSGDLTIGIGYRGSTPLQYALTQPAVILHYLRLALWPDALCLDYGWPLAKTARAIVPPALVIGALLAATIAAFRRRPEVGFAGAWFFLVLAPTSSVIPVADAAFEHRMYLPLAAVIALVVLAFRRLLERVRAALGMPPPAWRIVLAATVVLAAGAMALTTIRRQRDYGSAYAMWSDVVRKRPQNPRARVGLGLALRDQGRLDDAIVQYREALRLDPGYADAHDDLGAALAARGELEAAVAEGRTAVRLKPGSAVAHYHLGHALAALGRLEDAIAHYHEAIRLDPGDPEAHVELGRSLAAGGNLAQAIDQYRDAIRLDAKSSAAHNNLGVALVMQGKIEDAIAQWREAIRLDDGNAGAHSNLGVTLAQLGRNAEAIPELRRALELDPINEAAERALSAALQQSGK